ncbi:hypothetical protein D3C75_1346240 [compost metagenome]
MFSDDFHTVHTLFRVVIGLLVPARDLILDILSFQRLIQMAGKRDAGFANQAWVDIALFK